MEAQTGVGGPLRTAAILLTVSILALGAMAAAGADRKPTPARDNPAIPLEETRVATPTHGTPMSELGAGVYCQHCAVCHGDRGEGLTLAFRESFPQELQACWDSGCHDEEQSAGGAFSLPPAVPAVLGGIMADRFGSGSSLSAYVREHMPFHDPNALTAEEHDQASAFLALENDLDVEVAARETASNPRPTGIGSNHVIRATATNAGGSGAGPDPQGPRGLAVFVGMAATAGLLATIVFRQLRGKTSSEEPQ